MIKADKIIVCCSKTITGGPELLHQLVHVLRGLGREAFISYYPFDVPHECPEVYRKYNAPQTAFSDSPGTFIIVPETATRLLDQIKHADAGIWWLSVDNYFIANRQSWLMDFYLRYKSLVRGHRLSLNNLRRFKHFTQSMYAEDFLSKAGISSVRLSDYLSAEHLIPHDHGAPRENIVVYNPKKGQKQTLKLQRDNPDIKFVPISNMTPDQVAGLLSTAKIYCDFGHHPGKDRPPREAAMAGCCVITGQQGAARYFDDLSIPDNYKLDDGSSGFIRDFRPLAESIFANFSRHSYQFNLYRARIAQEPSLFMMQVKSIFGEAA